MVCFICNRGKNTDPADKTVRVVAFGDLRVALCSTCERDQHRVRALVSGAVERARR